jgi:glycosyltransferase involved in cell wall biosynthesis
VIHIGLLTVRNEADVLEEALAEQCRLFDIIVAQDGSTDGGTEILRACPQVKKLFLDSEILRPGERFCDAHRNVALQWILDNFGAKEVWVTLLHADEFFFDDPGQAAEQAHSVGASFALWGEFRFFLHTSDLDHPRLNRARKSVRDRVEWYAGPYFEIRQFCLEKHQVYLPGRDHCVLPSGFPGRRWKARIPRYRHYPYRSPEQMRRAYQDKCAGRYWQPDHAWIGNARTDDDLFLDGLSKPKNSPLAAWNNVARFDGTLPDPKNFLPAWWTG